MKPPAHTLLRSAALLLGALACTATLGAADRKPNILFIVADDMGFSDVACYGGEIQTPQLDRLAAEGLRFTQFYNTSRCWSSRACILTGYYAQAVRRDALTGIDLGQDNMDTGMRGTRPGWARLLPVYLKPLGYRSYHSGKWHVDGMPLKNGFDHSYSCSNAGGYFTSVHDTEDDVLLPAIKNDDGYYSTISIADHAIKYLREHAAKYPQQPFFEYVAFHSPHFPIQALPQDITIYKDRYRSGWDAIRQERLARMKKLGILNCDLSKLDPVTVPRSNLSEEQLHQRIGPNEVGHAVPWNTLSDGQKEFQAAKMSIHAAMIHRMDIEIGRIVGQLKTMDSLDNTIIFFMSDNGASAEQIIRGGGHDPSAPLGSAKTYLGIGPGWASTSNTPCRLYKMWEEEGGISTPLIVHWPAGIKAHGELRANPGHLIDLVPTVLELVGGEQPALAGGPPVPPLHGKSLVPAFAKDNTVKHDYLWFNHEGNRAIRIGDWKLVADRKSPWELYDLSTDRSETKNLSSARPEKVKELEQAWITHAKEFYAMASEDPALPAAPDPKKMGGATKLTAHSGGLHGYIGYSSSHPPAHSEFSAGMGFYSAVWPLIDRPLAGFQIGLPGTWILPENADNKDHPLAPQGTLARTWKERGPTWDSVFQTMEGGLGYWAGNHFRYGPPKFSMNGTPQCYDYEVGSPGWSFFYSNEALPDHRLGIAQLSNRLLIPPDALPFQGNPNGQFLGYSWMALPFTDPTTGDPPTGDQSWTCFLSAANFKGPIAYYIPETWSKIGKLFHDDEGHFLDRSSVRLVLCDSVETDVAASVPGVERALMAARSKWDECAVGKQ